MNYNETLQQNNADLESILSSFNSLPEVQGVYKGEIMGVGTLENTSWADIKMIGMAGAGADYWAVGDTKSVRVKGTVGTLAVDDIYYAYIIDFDHNETYEGNGITFGCFKTAGGVDVALIDSAYNSHPTNGIKYFNINHTENTNAGGWKSCPLRYDVLGSTDTSGGDASETTATNPVANTLMAALPSDLRAALKPMTIYTDNVGGGTNTASYVTQSIDYLPLLAEFEIFGVTTNSNSSEQIYQAQYAYYAAGNSKVKYGHNATTAKVKWWGRSPNNATIYYFCYVDDNGNTYVGDPPYVLGLAPIFRVG